MITVLVCYHYEMGSLESLRKEQLQNALGTIAQATEACMKETRHAAAQLAHEIATQWLTHGNQQKAEQLIATYLQDQTPSSDVLSSKQSWDQWSQQEYQEWSKQISVEQLSAWSPTVRHESGAPMTKRWWNDVVVERTDDYTNFVERLKINKKIWRCIEKLSDQDTFLPKLHLMTQYLWLDPLHVLAKFYNESRIRPDAKNTSPWQTASGLAQITQWTFAWLRETDISDRDLPEWLKQRMTVNASVSFSDYQSMSATQQLDRRFVYIKKTMTMVWLQKISDPAVLYACGFGVWYVQHAIRQWAIDPIEGKVLNPSFNIFHWRPNAKKLARLNGSTTGEITLDDIGHRLDTALT